MARKKKLKHYEDIEITGIADKGMSVGRDREGKVYFVEGAVPGDSVNIEVRRKKKGVPFGKVSQIKELSIHRTKPFCEHFGICGGCKWQNLNYEEQLRQKEQQVRDALKRIAKVKPVEFQSILGNDNIKHYRNKLEFSFSNKRWLTESEINSELKIEDKKALGFHRPGTFDKVIDINHCYLQVDLSDRIRKFLRKFTGENEFSYYDIRNNQGFLRELVIRTNLAGEAMVILILGNENEEKRRKILDALKKEFPEIISLYYIINLKKNSSYSDLEPELYSGKQYLIERLGKMNYCIGPKSFFQTNTQQAKKLYDIARDYADIQAKDIVYDLYTGLGSIALYIADQCSKVIGIEEIEEAISLAPINAKFNSIDNAYFHCGDVKEILKEEFVEKYGKADVIITDPPRMGMHKDVVEMLLKISASKIVYISCNPATQARDLALLDEKYILEKIRPVDMFPHTHHVESVALLTIR